MTTPKSGIIDVVIPPTNQEAARPYLHGLRHGTNVMRALPRRK